MQRASSRSGPAASATSSSPARAAGIGAALARHYASAGRERRPVRAARSRARRALPRRLPRAARRDLRGRRSRRGGARARRRRFHRALRRARRRHRQRRRLARHADRARRRICRRSARCSTRTSSASSTRSSRSSRRCAPRGAARSSASRASRAFAALPGSGAYSRVEGRGDRLSREPAPRAARHRRRRRHDLPRLHRDADDRAGNPYPMPFLMDADVAARLIARAIARRKRFYVLPWQMAIVGRVLRCCRGRSTTRCSRTRRASRRVD